ncbi:hypothetical protein FEM54_22950 [Pseudomonas edaphica]|uniref:Uncharacterized protein n=1 Tax=Pseudomonas edaphica TaxID=2006980 RepID=A0ABY2TZV6_9PSED|nr:hypothetical protein FEM54_22950 [Pseudomonas edaphica]
MWELACVGAGLPAMQTPRSNRHSEVMLSQASQLPHKPDQGAWVRAFGATPRNPQHANPPVPATGSRAD